MHIFVEKPRRSTTALVFFVSICKPIQQNCIFLTLETHPRTKTLNPYIPAMPVHPAQHHRSYRAAPRALCRWETREAKGKER
jgi:hypothetical protein